MTADLRVAIVGSGPSGLYAAEGLSKAGCDIDILERLPAPYGLLRYGVAPDHLKIKSLVPAMARILGRPNVRFLGGIHVGRDIDITSLRELYDVLVYATGAAEDRPLGIPGEGLDGSRAAREFVSWYSGHPDADPSGIDLSATDVVVVGAGNVAIDVARILARDPEELAGTDVPDHVLGRLRGSDVRDVHIVARRGPSFAKFSTTELREVGELANVDVIVRAAEVDGTDDATADPEQLRNLELFREWSRRPRAGKPRRIHFRFGLSPAELIGHRRVDQVVLDRMVPGGSGTWVATGEREVLRAGLLLRAVGYRGVPVAGVPFDEHRGVIPHQDGRVVGSAGDGQYAVGWIKRGPSGVIGTNKADAQETVATILAAAPTLPRAAIRDPRAILDRLGASGVTPVTWAGWLAIDAAEVARGATRGAPRVKLSDRKEMEATALSAQARPDEETRKTA